MNTLRIPRRAAAPLVAAGALLALPAIAGAATVEPVYHAGNPTCADLGYSHGVKFDPPSAGSRSADGVTIDMSLADDQFGKLVSWTASAPIDAVLVKGGANANAYVYPGESSGDTGLHTPFNGPDMYYGLSHVDFCWDDQTPPPPAGQNPPPVVTVPPPAQPGEPPAGEVLGEEPIVAGKSRMRGPSGCIGTTVKATVKGSRIAKVTFLLDGRKAKVVKGAGSFSVKSSTLSAGVHRIKARVTYEAASATAPRTHVLTFQRCIKRKIAPRFAG
jgi:hypothetical protein